jgi:tellurite methyltransferase
MSLEDNYNRIYTERETAFCGGEPEKTVVDILKYKSSGTALELGAGEGRNSLFLAENGFDVTAQDLSQVGIEKLRKSAEEKGLDVHTEIGDMQSFPIDKDYDVLISTNVLHHLPKQDALNLIKRMQLNTKLGGLNTIVTFTDKGDFYSSNPNTKKFFPKEGELKDLYSEWDILEYAEEENPASRKKEDGSRMINIMAKIIAKKK